MPRIGQRQVLPISIRRRHSPTEERVATAIVSEKGGIGDFTNIQKAINFVNDLGGGIVFLREGTYVLDRDVELFSNIHLTGENNSNTVLDFNIGDHGVSAIGTSLSRLNNIRVSNLKISNSARISSTGGGLGFFYVDDSVIENCHFSFGLDSSSYEPTNVALTNCNRIIGINNKFTSGYNGFYLSGCNYCLINHNYFESLRGSPVTLITSGSYNQISDNITNSCVGTSIIVLSNTDCLIAFNQIIDSGFRAINIAVSSHRAIVANNIGNQGTSNDNYGITLHTVDRAIVQGNIMRSFDHDGILLDSSVDNSMITGNICTSNGGYGVNVSNANCDNNLVHGNHLLGNTTGSLSDSGTGTTSADNVV